MPDMLLWVYIALLLAGGITGYVKAKSKASIITSSIFAVLLALCALGVLRWQITPRFGLADLLIALLLVFFARRFIAGKKFMPAGLMTVASLGVLLARLFIH